MSDGAYPDLEYHSTYRPTSGAVGLAAAGGGGGFGGARPKTGLGPGPQPFSQASPQILEKKREVLEIISHQKKAVREAKSKPNGLSALQLLQ